MIRNGDRYNVVCDRPKVLSAKKATVEHDELTGAFVKSGKTYDEVMVFLGTGNGEAADDEKPSRRRGSPLENGCVTVMR